jgi:hypothetical protein
MPSGAQIPELIPDGSPLRFLQVSVTLSHASLLESLWGENDSGLSDAATAGETREKLPEMEALGTAAGNSGDSSSISSNSDLKVVEFVGGGRMSPSLSKKSSSVR